jgi:hypothetical protein
MWIKSAGPLMVPCGTLPLTNAQSDFSFPILSHCANFVRKLWKHCIIMGSALVLCNFSSDIK